MSGSTSGKRLSAERLAEIGRTCFDFRPGVILGDDGRELLDHIAAVEAELAEAKRCSANVACEKAFAEQGGRLRAAKAENARLRMATRSVLQFSDRLPDHVAVNLRAALKEPT